NLIEDFAIALAPSVTMLDAATRRVTAPPSRELLALGNPLPSSRLARSRNLFLGPLPDAAREVRALAGVYGSDRVTVLTGSAARETTLKNIIGDYRIVHLATHGFVDHDPPPYSALVLARAPADPDDRLLEMPQI